MERNGIHELSAAYALHALAEEERSAFEDHLAHCPECRRDVAAFQETAAAMAYDVDAPAPPPALRDRILVEARSERPNVVSLQARRRWALPVAGGLAAAAAIAALALGIWAFSLSSSLADEREALDRSEQAVSVLAQEGSSRIPLEGANGFLVVNEDGEGSLVVFGLESAPTDKTYEAWVIEGDEPTPAGLFRGGEPQTVVELTAPVPEGALVAVTLERSGGVQQPQSEPVFAASQTT